jgi:hypothetical protein
MSPPLKYLGGVIPFAFAVVFVIYVVILAIFFRSKRDQRVSPDGDGQPVVARTEFQRYFRSVSFENVYQSPWGYCFMFLLFLTRLGCFVFFYGNDMIWGLVRHTGNSAIYFTNWNIYLISLYYFVSSVASAIGICKDNAFREYIHQHQHNRNRDNLSFWTDSMTTLGSAVHILFEIGGSTAFFITVIDFCTLDPKFGYWNVCLHFVTSVSFLVELVLNSMVVQWYHVLFTVTWGLMYLIFIWPMVATGAATKWPYFFLKTEKVVFGWYIFLFLALIFFYYVFYGVDALKWAIVGKKPYAYENTPLSQPPQQIPVSQEQLMLPEKPSVAAANSEPNHFV